VCRGPAEAVDLPAHSRSAAGYGARTVTEGVETWADFLAAREMGFDLVQGFLFAKPMSDAQNFAQTCWAASHTCLPSAILVRWGVDLRDRRRTAERSASCARRIPRGRSREMTTSRVASGHDALEGLMHRDERVLKRSFQRGEVGHLGGAREQIFQCPRRLLRHERLVETESEHLGQGVI
jgi:hypothetical protein